MRKPVKTRAKPVQNQVRSLETLYSLEALDDEGRLTAAGRSMSRFPLDPMAAKALLAAAAERCVGDVCGALAMLDCEGLFFAPRGKAREAGAARARFVAADGDHAMLLRIFQARSLASPYPRYARSLAALCPISGRSRSAPCACYARSLAALCPLSGRSMSDL